MPDPDLLAIQRKRRREGRCLRCGLRTPRAALCAACRADWRYCPRCERVHAASETSQKTAREGRATSYCLPCSNRQRNGDRPSRAAYEAACRARRDARIRQALRLYRAGLSTRAMAARMGLSVGALSGLISYARRIGRWPADLRRRRAA